MNQDDILSFLRDFKIRYAGKYGIVSLGVFGSVARGEIRDDGDVDIYVATATPDPFALVHIKDDIERELRRPVSMGTWGRPSIFQLKERSQSKGRKIE